MAETCEDRLQDISTNAVLQLTQIGVGAIHSEFVPGVFEALPEALSVEEVASIGGRVVAYSEMVSPQKNSAKQSLKIETRMTRSMASAALARGDMVTVDSAVEYLESLPTVRSALSAFLAKHHFIV